MSAIHLRHALLLLLSGFALAADPTTWQRTDEGVISYLTIQGDHICLQQADGTSISALRLVLDPAGDGQACYLLGKPNGYHLKQEAATVTLIDAAGKRTLFTPCPTPPATIGWQPYVIPATPIDAAKRKVVTDEIVRRFAKEQELRRTQMRLSQGDLSQQALAKPEIKKVWEEISVVDEDNFAWLQRTLLSDGWIGRKSHGDQAHTALLLISLHNIQHLRFAATILAQLRAEQQRGEINEMPVANVSDRFALILGDPLSYGIQATVDAAGSTIIPVIADAELLDANRARIGVGTMASAVGMTGAKILRIGADGRLVGEGVANARGLDAVDGRRAMREPIWGLDAIAKADPVLGAAIAAGKAGDSKPIAAWAHSAPVFHLNLVGQVLLAQNGLPDGEGAVIALRPLFDGMLDGMPAANDALRLMMGNSLAYSLVARATPPTPEELAHASILGDHLDQALQRPEVGHGFNGHGIADTVACIRFLQGDRPKAVALWKKAIELAGTEVPDLYRRRLAAAEGPATVTALPR